MKLAIAFVMVIGLAGGSTGFAAENPSLDQALTRYDQAQSADFDSFSKAVTEVHQEISKSQELERSSSSAIQDPSYAKKKQEIDAIQKEVRQLQFEASDMNMGDTQRRLGDLDTRRRKLQKELDQATDQAKQSRKIAGDAQAKTAEIEKKWAGTYYTPTKEKPIPDTADLKTLREQVLRQKMAEGVDRQIKGYFDSVRDDYMKAGLLVADLDELQAKNSEVKAHLDEIKAEANARLSKTLLGNYIQSEIKKAMASQPCSCSAMIKNPTAPLEPAKTPGAVPAVSDSSVKIPDSIGPFDSYSDYDAAAQTGTGTAAGKPSKSGKAR